MSFPSFLMTSFCLCPEPLFVILLLLSFHLLHLPLFSFFVFLIHVPLVLPEARESYSKEQIPPFYILFTFYDSSHETLGLLRSLIVRKRTGSKVVCWGSVCHCSYFSANDWKRDWTPESHWWLSMECVIHFLWRCSSIFLFTFSGLRQVLWCLSSMLLSVGFFIFMLDLARSRWSSLLISYYFTPDRFLSSLSASSLPVKVLTIYSSTHKVKNDRPQTRLFSRYVFHDIPAERNFLVMKCF